MNRFTLSALTLALISGFSYADEEPQVVETVVITATRSAQTLENTLSDVSVITRDDIEKSSATSLPELLNRAPGVQVVSNGGKGKAGLLSIRGTKSNQNVVLVDGVRQMHATDGAANLQFIPLDQIERIEIVRGSASSLYGADAMGGVIQIFTKTPTDVHRQSAGVGVGSYNYSEAHVGATGKFGRLGYQINVSHENEDGFSTQNAKADNPAWFYTHNSDRDGYRNTTFSGKLDYEWLAGQNVKMSYYQGEGNSEFDQSNILQDEHDFKLKQFSIESSNVLIVDKLFSSLRYSEFEDKSELYNRGSTGGRQSHINTKTREVSWVLNAKPVNDLSVLLGVDWKRDMVDVWPNNYDRTARENKAVFTGFDWTVNKHLLESSVRYDDNQQFGSKTTGRLAYGYKVTPKLAAKVSYATGFRAPSFSELYSPPIGIWPAYGNPDLKPEKNRNVEFGLSYTDKLYNVTWVVFQNNIKDVITGVDIGGGWAQRAFNVDKARIRGTTVTFDTTLSDQLTFKFDATYQDPMDKTKGEVLIRRARVFGSTGIDFTPHENWTFNASLNARGKTLDYGGVKLGGYTTVNLGVRYKITPTLSTSLTAENLFDREYMDTYGYNTPGQSVFWRINYQN